MLHLNAFKSWMNRALITTIVHLVYIWLLYSLEGNKRITKVTLGAVSSETHPF